MSKKLYIECNNGISGDMTVAALIDLGVDKDKLIETIKTLPIEGYKIEFTRVKKAGIDCCDFNVILDESMDNHDHDMAYLHSTNHETNLSGKHNTSEHKHGHEHDNNHHHAQNHEHIHHHEHRGLDDIISIINQGRLTENARNLAISTFQILAEAEAKAHGVSLEAVHFHEVGAIDSIIDIVAVAICIDELSITDVIFSNLSEGTGTIRCQHGILSIPVPAVANIISAYDIPMQIMDIQGEFVTPTGAAIVASLRTLHKLPASFTIKKIGMGAGKRNYERPSILRAMIIETTDQETDSIYKLETNIDDCSGEILGYVMERLFENGAKDVYYSPIFMKKNRPAWQLSVTCTEEDVKKLENIIFSETTTIGIRHQKLERTILSREIMEIETKYGTILAKKCKMEDHYRIYPEYHSIAEKSKMLNLPYLEVYNEVLRICNQE